MQLFLAILIPVLVVVGFAGIVMWWLRRNARPKFDD